VDHFNQQCQLKRHGHKSRQAQEREKPAGGVGVAQSAGPGEADNREDVGCLTGASKAENRPRRKAENAASQA
jgi:hypothetical protein